MKPDNGDIREKSKAQLGELQKDLLLSTTLQTSQIKSNAFCRSLKECATRMRDMLFLCVGTGIFLVSSDLFIWFPICCDMSFLGLDKLVSLGLEMSLLHVDDLHPSNP